MNNTSQFRAILDAAISKFPSPARITNPFSEVGSVNGTSSLTVIPGRSAQAVFETAVKTAKIRNLTGMPTGQIISSGVITAADPVALVSPAVIISFQGNINNPQAELTLEVSYEVALPSPVGTGIVWTPISMQYRGNCNVANSLNGIIARFVRPFRGSRNFANDLTPNPAFSDNATYQFATYDQSIDLIGNPVEDLLYCRGLAITVQTGNADLVTTVKIIQNDELDQELLYDTMTAYYAM